MFTGLEVPVMELAAAGLMWMTAGAVESHRGFMSKTALPAPKNLSIYDRFVRKVHNTCTNL